MPLLLSQCACVGERATVESVLLHSVGSGMEFSLSGLVFRAAGAFTSLAHQYFIYFLRPDSLETRFSDSQILLSSAGLKVCVYPTMPSLH